MFSQLQRILARIRALTNGDWRGRAGTEFNETMSGISEFCRDRGLDAGSLADHASTAISGAANEKLARAMESFAEAEKLKTEAELARRSAKALYRKAEADANKAEADATRALAEAHMAQTNAIAARAELLAKLDNLGVAVVITEDGRICVTPAPEGLNMSKLVTLDAGDGDMKAHCE